MSNLMLNPIKIPVNGFILDQNKMGANAGDLNEPERVYQGCGGVNGHPCPMEGLVIRAYI